MPYFLKDLRLFYSDVKTVLLTFLLPLVLVTIFVVAFSGMRGSSKKGNIGSVKIAVVDGDQTVASKRVIKQLGEQPLLRVAVADSALANKALKQGKVLGVLNIHKGFLAAFMKDRSDLKWSFNYMDGAEFQVNTFKSVFLPSLEKIGMDNGVINEDCKSKASLPFVAIKGNKKRVASNSPWLIQPIIGITIILLLFNAINIGGSILDEFNDKTWERVQVYSKRFWPFFMSKFWVCFLTCLAQMTLIIGFSVAFLGLKLFNPLLITLLVLVTCFVCASFCIFITSISKSRAQLNNLVTAVVLFFSAVGGSMVPMFIMPSIMHSFAKISLNYWALEAFYDVLWRGLENSSVILFKVAILGVISICFFGIGFILLRRRPAIS